MYLFLILSVLLFFTIIVSLFRRKEHEHYINTRIMSYVAFFKGMVCFFPALLVFIYMKDLIPISYKPASVYFRNIFNDLLIFQILSVVGFFLLNRKYLKDTNDNFLLYFSFSSGYFFIISLYVFISGFGMHDVYSLFILPSNYIDLVLISTLLYSYSQNENKYLKITFLISLIFIPLVPGIGIYLYHSNFILWSLIISGSIFLVIVFVFIFTSVRRFTSFVYTSPNNSP